MEVALTKFFLFSIAMAVIGTAIGIWITYAVLKAAIRDGINESSMGRAALRPGSRGPSEPEEWGHHVEAMKVRDAAKKMPPIRAD